MRRIKYKQFTIEVNRYSFDLSMDIERKEPKPGQDKVYTVHQGFFTNFTSLLEDMMRLDGMNQESVSELKDYLSEWKGYTDEIKSVMNKVKKEV